MNILVIVFAVLSIALAASTLKWRANAKLFETCWKEADKRRAEVDAKAYDLAEECLSKDVEIADLKATIRCLGSALEDSVQDELQYKAEIYKLKHMSARQHGEILMVLATQSEDLRKQVRGLGAKLMRV